jgi:rhodanese-related sulfurtransferase
MQPKELQKLLKSKQATVLDVRSGMEYRMGHIPGAIHLPLWRVMFRLLGDVSKQKTARLVVVCESGARSSLAVDMLRKRGFTGVELLDGDMYGWRQAKLPVEK